MCELRVSGRCMVWVGSRRQGSRVKRGVLYQPSHLI